MKKLLALLIVFVLGVAMAHSAEFLINAQNHWMDALTPTEVNGMDQQALDNYTARGQKGDIVIIGVNGSMPEAPAPTSTYIIIKVPEISYAEAQAKSGQWNASLAVNILSANQATDTYTIQLTANNVNVNTGEGKVTQTRVQNFLTNWNMKNVVIGDNSVQFDAMVFEVLQSNKYLEMDCSLCTFTETDYTQATGTHRVRIDASALNLTGNQFDNAVSNLSQRLTFVSQNRALRRATFDIYRDNVRQAFTMEVNKTMKRLIRKCRWKVSAELVDTVIASGRMVTMSRDDFISYLTDKQNLGQ
jgi:hypothetical protein